jgi:hypothetical protein
MGPGGDGGAAAAAPTIAPAWSPLSRDTGGRADLGAVTSNKDGTRRRYEFVVMMIWREPTPSNPAAAPAPAP